MPRLITQEFNAPQQRRSGIQTAQATAQTFGGGLTSDAGALIVGLGDVVTKNNISTERSSVTNMMLKGGEQWENTLLQRSKDADPGAPNFTSSLKAELTTFFDTARANYETKEGLELFDVNAIKLRRSILSRAAAFETEESGRFAVEQVTDSFTSVINRVGTDPTYYQNAQGYSEAGFDVGQLAARLVEKGLPQRLADQQVALWQNELDVGAALSNLNHATTPETAQLFLDEMEAADSPWKDKLDPKNFAQILQSARGNVITTNAKKKANELETRTDTQHANTQDILRNLVALVDDEGRVDPASKSRLSIIRQKALDTPGDFNLRAVIQLDNALGALGAARKAAADAETKRVAEDFDLEREWSVVALKQQVVAAETAQDLAGLSIGYAALQKRFPPGDPRGLTPTQWLDVSTAVTRKYDDFAKKAAADFEKKKADIAERDKLEALNLTEVDKGRLMVHTAEVTTLGGADVVLSAINANAKLSESEKTTLRDRLRKRRGVIDTNIKDAAKKEEAARKQSVKDTAELDFVNLALQVSAVTDVAEAYVASEGIKQNKNLTPREKLTLFDRLRPKQDAILEAIMKKESKRAERFRGIGVEKLDRLSQRPDLSVEDATQLEAVSTELRDAGQMTPAEWGNIVTRLDKTVIEAGKKAARGKKVIDAINDTYQMSPTSKDDQKAIDEAYEAAEVQLADQPPEQQHKAKVALVEHTGMLPKPLLNEITGGINSQKPTQMVEAVTLLRELESTSPQMAAQLSKGGDAVTFARQVGDFVSWGLTPPEAVQRTKDLREVPESTRNARAAEFTRLKKAEDFDTEFEDIVGSEVFDAGIDDAEINPVMRGEFMSLYEVEYVAGGNIESAKNAAIATVRGVWGVQHYDGEPVTMKFAPAKFYGRPELDPEQNSEWILEQAVDDILATDSTVPLAGIDETRIRLTLHPTQSNGSKPAYAVTLLPLPGQEGFSLGRTILGSDGFTAAVFVPNYSSSAAARRWGENLAERKRLARALVGEDEDTNSDFGGGF